MKRIITFLLTAVVLLASCSSDDNVETPTKASNPYDESITGTVNSCERPDWKKIQGLSYSSMSVFIDEYGIPCQLSEGDIVAAFINGECRGVAYPIYDSSQGYWRFNLSVCSTPADEGRSGIKVGIRYYSALNKGFFESVTFDYLDGVCIGENLKGKGLRLEWK